MTRNELKLLAVELATRVTRKIAVTKDSDPMDRNEVQYIAQWFWLTLDDLQGNITPEDLRKREREIEASVELEEYF
jgi:hypothetical protein